MKTHNVITIGFAKQALVKGSREYERMLGYAGKLNTLTVVVFTRKRDGFTAPLSMGSLTVHPTNTHTRVGALIKAFFIVRSILKQHTGTSYIISTQDPLETGWLSWMLAHAKNARLHVQVHGDYFDSGWAGHSILRMMKQVCALLLLKHAPQIRVVSERIKKSLVRRGIHASRITVLPIRPELEQFLRVAPTPHEICTCIYVGRLAPEKDVSRIIHAFAELQQKGMHARLRIVGRGVCEKRVRALVASYGIEDIVDFVPWTEEVAQEMARADVCVLASKHEAYGLVLLEAMAVGLPVVTTDVGCVGEVVQDGVHGIVVREEGVAPFTEALYTMCRDSAFRESCGTNAKKTAQEIAQVSRDAYVASWVSALTKTE